MTSFWWFLSANFLAALSVGMTTRNLSWGCTTLIVGFAIRNAVVSGYVEGRTRFEYEQYKSIKRQSEGSNA